jgi:hypothetical protein
MQAFREYTEPKADGPIDEIENYLRNYDIATMSAFRNEYDRGENLARNAKMKRDLVKQGFKVLECPGSGYVEERTDTGEPKEVIEDSFFVVNIKEMDSDSFRNIVHTIGNKYEQESVAVGDKSRVRLVNADGSSFVIGGTDKVRSPNVGPFFTTYKGVRFEFVEPSSNVTENADYMEGHFEDFADFKKQLKKAYRIKRIGQGSFSDVYLVRPKSMAGLLVGFKKDFVLKITKENNSDHDDVDGQAQFVKVVRDNKGRNMLYPIITHFMTLDSKSGKEIDITVMEYLKVDGDSNKTKAATGLLQRYARLIDELGYEEPHEDHEDFEEYEELVDDFDHEYGVQRDDLLDFHASLYGDLDLEYDIHAWNIGFRKDGSLVIFDPVA